MNAGLSRWTISYFAVALAAFLLAQILMVLGFAYPAEPLFATRTLLVVHLLTIGWLTLLMLGALLQFVPVLTGKGAIGDRAGLIGLVAIGFGLILMLAGFFALGGTVAKLPQAALPIGGGLVLIGLVTVAIPLGRVLAESRPLALPARFVAVGLSFLVLTACLGLSFAVILAWPERFSSADWLARGLPLHFASGLVGWFTLTAMGVTYRLLSMFMLSPQDDTRLGNVILALAAAALGLIWLSAFLAGPSEQAIALAGSLVLVLALALYLADMVRIFARRRRPVLELNSRAAAAALLCLALFLPAFAYLTLVGKLGAFAGPIGYLFFFGWLSGLGLSQLYKIVPFLTWLERYGPRLGKEPVPRVQDLISETRAAPWFALYFLAVLFGTVAGFLNRPLLWRGAIFVHLVASLFIVRELWRARSARPAAASAAAGAASSTKQSPASSGETAGHWKGTPA